MTHPRTSFAASVLECRSPLAHPSIGKSIAIAEGVSSIVSIGSVWLLGKNESSIEPARDFLAKRILYPVMGGKHGGDKPDAGIMEKAKNKASTLIKGVIMVGTGFATFVPTQMLLDGKCDFNEFKQVIKGKSLGLVVTLASLGVLTKLAPNVMKGVEHAADKYVAEPLCMGIHPKCDDPKKGGHCEEAHELCKLLIMDIPSSVISGLVNYRFTKGMVH